MKKILTLGVVAVILVVIAYVAWGKVKETLLATAPFSMTVEVGANSLRGGPNAIGLSG